MMILPSALSPGASAPDEPALAGAGAAAAGARLAAAAEVAGVITAAVQSPGPPLGSIASTGTPATTTRRGPAARASVAGYASTAPAKATSTKTTATQTTAMKTATSSSKTVFSHAASSDPLAFLSDPKLSVEEKLFRFMTVMAQKYDDQLEQKMAEIRGESPAKKSSGSSSGKKTGGTSGSGSPGSTAKPKKKGGLFGSFGTVLKVAFPGVGITLELLKMKEVQGLLKTLSGPVLAAGATALGFPALAPVLMKAGPDIANVAVGLAKSIDGVLSGASGTSGGGSAGGSSGTKAGGSSGTSAGASAGDAAGSGKNEQVQMMELQRIQEKQKEMFSVVSNILRAMHDTKMAMINNLRA